MTKKMQRVRRQSFTLVEVIAVLLIIAILAAVAAPKFIGMATEARNGVAKAGINEAKASLSVAYAKAYLVNNGTNPTVAQVLSAANFTSGTTYAFGDINVNMVSGANLVTVTAIDVKGTPVTTAADTWTLPVN